MKNLNYSLRYLLKNRGNSITRLVSLALGLIVSLLICSYVGLNLSYGRFFPDRERVYQLFERTPQFGISGYMLEPVAPTIKENIPQCEAVTNVYQQYINIKVGDSQISDARTLAVASDFFDVLDFGVVCGDPKRVLSKEGLANNEMMISERLAEKLFGEDDPLGQMIRDTEGKEYVVAGVFRDTPINSPIYAFDGVTFLDYNPQTANWQGDDSYPTYIKLRKGVTREEAETALKEFMEGHEILSQLVEMWKAEYFLVPIEDAYYVDNNTKATQTIYGILALLALLVATLNYVLLTLSSLAQRSRTVAMLRCNGASRLDVFRMLLSETLIMIVAAIVLAVFVIACLHQEIYQFLHIHLSDLFALERLWIAVTVCLVSFLVAGLIPASLYSRVSMSYAFRRGSDNRTWWKRTLLFVQVACTTGIVCFLLTTAQQSKYIDKADMGYDYKNVVMLKDGYPVDYTAGYALGSEIRKLPFVASVGHSYQYPIWGYMGNPVVDQNEQEILFSCRFEYIDQYYLETMGIELLAGRNIHEQDNITKAIVNEEFVFQHGWDLESAIGEHFWQNGEWREVVGVVNNFLQAGGYVLPITFYNVDALQYGDRGTLPLRISVCLTDATPENIKQLNGLLSRFSNINSEFHFVPYADTVKARFRFRDEMRDSVLIVSLATLLISLIGLVGYLGNEMARRRKEIAIRKVNGATTSQVLRLLSLNISWVVIPAVVTGVAGAVWGGMRYLELLETMCEPLTWWLFAAGATIVIIIVYAILVARTWHTANANPIDMIKIE